MLPPAPGHLNSKSPSIKQGHTVHSYFHYIALHFYNEREPHFQFENSQKIRTAIVQHIVKPATKLEPNEH